jgi:hypothetical protein
MAQLGVACVACVACHVSSGVQGVQLSQGPNAQLIRLVNFHVLFQKLSNFGLGPDVLDMTVFPHSQQNTKITGVESVNLCWKCFVEE